MKAAKAFLLGESHEITVCNFKEGSVNYIAYKEYSPKKRTAVSADVPVILLHELMRAKETWDECGQSIADRTSSKVYSLDARNHGDSEWVDIMDYDSMADDVSKFMDTMGIPKAIIVGHGMGAKTGMILALKHPKKIQSLISEDTSMKSHSKNREQLRYEREKLRDILEFLYPNIGLKEAKKMAVSGMIVRHYYYRIKKRTNRPKIWDGSDLPLKKKTWGGFEWNLNLKSIEDNMDTEPWSQTGVFDGPVLVIYGTGSANNVLDERVEYLKQFPRTLYEPIQDGDSHPLHIEYPDMFTDLVCNFILKQRGLT